MSAVTDLLRAALEQLTEAAVVADAHGRVTFVNDAATRLHGVAHLDVLPESYASTYSLFAEDGTPYPSTELPLARAVLRGETVTDARWLIRRADGSEVIAVGSARPVRDAQGAQIGAVLTIRDDTANVAAANALRERDSFAERLRAAFVQSPVSTVVYDARGRPVAANPAFERLWGAGMADVPPTYSVLADPQLDAAGMLPLIRRAFEGEPVSTPPIRYEMGAAVGRGRVLWTQAHLYPVRNDAGEIEQVVLTHEDVTARREAETALADVLARAQRLQALSAALSMASTGDEVALAVVEHARAVLGGASVIIARLSVTGQHLEVMRVGELPDDIAREWHTFPISEPVPLADVARTGVPIFLENRDEWTARYPQLLRTLEAAGHHATAAAPLVVDGRVLGVLGVAFAEPRMFTHEDRALALTVAQQCAQALERARLFEAERTAREEAEAANRGKGDFLAVMSHELRTPLNAIGGYAELLSLGIRGPVTETQLQDLARIQASQRHLLGLINEVLNYAKLESGSVRYDLLDIVARDALTNAVSLVTPQAVAKHLQISLGACEPGAIVRGDPDKIQQILINLLSNAVKFTDSGRIELACCADGDRVRMTVHDTGIGIAAEHLARIFEPFVQVRPDLTRTAEGTGLGLAISRDLARGMGGDLTVDSETGRGSTFTLVLPRP